MPNETNEDFEAQIRRFEAAWRTGNVPDLADWLSSSFSQSLCIELVCIDLEFRWKLAERRSEIEIFRLKDYELKSPELFQDHAWPAEVLGEEYRLRKRHGENPEHAEYLQRPQGNAEALSQLLQEIDREEACERSTDSLRIADMALQPEDVLPDVDAPLNYGDYKLQKLLGAGLTGRVYQAWQRSLDRPVAVKYLRKTFQKDGAAVRRFLAEARAVAKIRHPHVVGIHGIGKTPAGGYFFVMDWLPGPDLATVIQTEKNLSESDVLQWTKDVTSAISQAHRLGIVHCDLKPANLLLTEERGAVVTDFGLSRSLDAPGGTDAIEGTAPFMAPEQISSFWGTIDHRADVYGIGAVLYNLLTGQAPHTGRTIPDILAKVLAPTPVPSPRTIRSDLSAELCLICEKCLAKCPDDRFPTTEALSAALSKLSV